MYENCHEINALVLNVRWSVRYYKMQIKTKETKNASICLTWRLNNKKTVENNENYSSRSYSRIEGLIR